eukprot:2934801-Rhodomonas_salina.1
MLAKRKFHMAKVDEKIGKAPTRLLELGDEDSTRAHRVRYWYRVCGTICSTERGCVVPGVLGDRTQRVQPTDVPMVPLPIDLRACYAMSGTALAHSATCRRACAMRCPVLTCRMLLPGP